MERTWSGGVTIAAAVSCAVLLLAQPESAAVQPLRTAPNEKLMVNPSCGRSRVPPLNPTGPLAR